MSSNTWGGTASTSTYTDSSGTVHFVYKGAGGEASGADEHAPAAFEERAGVTPSGQRVFILPKAVNADINIFKGRGVMVNS